MGRCEKRQGPMGLRLATRERLMSRLPNIGHVPRPERKKTGVSDVQKRFGTRQWPGASQPRPQITSETPRASRRVWLASEWPRAIDAFSTQRAKNEQCSDSLRNVCNSLMLSKLWRIMDRSAAADSRNPKRDFTGLLRSATKSQEIQAAI